MNSTEHVDLRALDSFNHMVFSQLVDDFEKVYLFSQFDDELVSKEKLKIENKYRQLVDDFEKVYLFSQFDDELVSKENLKSENKYCQLVDDFEKVYLFSQLDDELVSKAKLKSENKSLQCKFQKLLVAARDMVVQTDGLVEKCKVQSHRIEELREEVGISTIVKHKQEED